MHPNPNLLLHFTIFVSLVSLLPTLVSTAQTSIDHKDHHLSHPTAKFDFVHPNSGSGGGEHRPDIDHHHHPPQQQQQQQRRDTDNANPKYEEVIDDDIPDAVHFYIDPHDPSASASIIKRSYGYGYDYAFNTLPNADASPAPTPTPIHARDAPKKTSNSPTSPDSHRTRHTHVSWSPAEIASVLSEFSLRGIFPNPVSSPPPPSSPKTRRHIGVVPGRERV